MSLIEATQHVQSYWVMGERGEPGRLVKHSATGLYCKYEFATDAKSRTLYEPIQTYPKFLRDLGEEEDETQNPVYVRLHRVS